MTLGFVPNAGGGGSITARDCQELSQQSITITLLDDGAYVIRASDQRPLAVDDGASSLFLDGVDAPPQAWRLHPR